MKLQYPLNKFKHALLFISLMISCLATAPEKVSAYSFATFVMDAHSGKELHSQNGNRKLNPASLTKMMTLYLAFNEVENGNLSLDQRVSISKNAVREPPSKFGYKVGQRVSIRYLIRAAAIRSANDAATALGEAISGSEAEFAQYMTRTARAMGMINTTFRNANGLTASGHLSSAEDMAILGRRLFYDFPEYFHLFGRSSVVSLGRTLYNTNRKFLSSYSGADGIKTGFTSAAGYNLAASAKRGNKRVIAVVFGSGSVKLRTKRMTELLDIGFAKAKSYSRKKSLDPLNLEIIKKHSQYARGAVSSASAPIGRPITLFQSVSLDVQKINDIIEGMLTSVDVEEEDILFGELRVNPPARPNFFKAMRAQVDTSSDTMEDDLINILKNQDLERSYRILVGSYFTDFNAKKDLSRLALSDLETLGGLERSVTTGVVDQKRVFRVSFTGLKKSDALKACQKLIARNEICEISEFER